MSAASSLRNAVADSAEFPNKATFQHLFMRGLLKNPRPSTQVLPELSEVLPVLPVSGVITKVDGRIDFFVSGDLRWDVELLTKGNRRAQRKIRSSRGKVQRNALLTTQRSRGSTYLRPPGPGELSQKVASDSKDIMTIYFAENFQSSSAFYSSWSDPRARVITLRK